jgi:hypothetical protein
VLLLFNLVNRIMYKVDNTTPNNATLDRTSLLTVACTTHPRLVPADGTDTGDCLSDGVLLLLLLLFVLGCFCF